MRVWENIAVQDQSMGFPDNVTSGTDYAIQIAFRIIRWQYKIYHFRETLSDSK